MRNKRWNPALRHTVLGEPGNAEWLATRPGKVAPRPPEILRKSGPMRDRTKYNRKPKHRQEDRSWA